MSGVVWGIDPLFLKEPAMAPLRRTLFVSRGQAFRQFWKQMQECPALLLPLANTLRKGVLFPNLQAGSFSSEAWSEAEERVAEIVGERFASMHPRLVRLWRDEKDGQAFLVRLAMDALRESFSPLAFFERLFRLCLWSIGEQEASRLHVAMVRFWEAGEVTLDRTEGGKYPCVSYSSRLDEQGFWLPRQGSPSYLVWRVGCWWKRGEDAWEKLSPVLVRALPRFVRLFGFFMEDPRFSSTDADVCGRLWKVSPFSLLSCRWEREATVEPLAFLRDFSDELENLVLVRYEVDASTPDDEARLRRMGEEALWSG